MSTPKLTPLQRRVNYYDLRYSPRHTILHGAVRSGKTHINLILWLRHIRRFHDRGLKFIMSSPTLGSLRRNVLDELSSIYGIDTSLNSHNSFHLFGNKIVCFNGGLSSSQRVLKGFTAYGWFANETTEHHSSFIRQALSRCSGEGARIFWDTNPATPSHFLKTEFIDRNGQRLPDGRIALKAWHFRLEDNTFLDPIYVDSLKRSMPSDSAWYKRYIDGQWVSAGRAIYTHYRIVDINPKTVLQDFEEVIGGLDFGRGGISPYAFLLIGRNGDSWTVVDEVYRQNCLNSEFIQMVRSRLDSHDPNIRLMITIYGDSSDPDKLVEWARSGFAILGANKSPYSVRAGIESVMSQRLAIASHCHQTLREIEGYEWEADREGKTLDRPIKFNDHCMDALRYAIYSHTRRMSNRSVVQPGKIWRDKR